MSAPKKLRYSSFGLTFGSNVRWAQGDSERCKEIFKRMSDACADLFDRQGITKYILYEEGSQADLVKVDC